MANSTGMYELDTLRSPQTTHHSYNDEEYHDESSHSDSDQEEHENITERTIYLLGHPFSPADAHSISSFQRKLYWMTYRNELMVGLKPYCGGGKFVGVSGSAGGSHIAIGGEESLAAIAEAASSGLRTDAGWGCMLRSAQMMLAQTIRVHFAKGSILNNREKSLEEMRMATWFADFPNPDLAFVDICEGIVESSNDASDCNVTMKQQQKSNSIVLLDNHHWYSLHQMVAAGLGLGVLPGEWYGPTTACHVLRELNEMHCSHGRKRHEQNGNVEKEAMFRVHVATEGCIYLDVISKLMIPNNEKEEQPAEMAHPLAIDDPLGISANQTKQEWETSLLLLLPLRLGIQSIPTQIYGGCLSKMMQLSQSVGMLGGTPRHALWFYGAEDVGLQSSDGRVGGWYGLDPHVTQPAPRGELEIIPSNCDSNSSNGNSFSKKRYRWKVHLNDSYLRSLHIGAISHSNHDISIPLSKLDPSLALGFYIRNNDDFMTFQQSINELNSECKKYKSPSIVTFMDKSPNYEVDVGTAMKNMTLNGNKNAGLDDLDGFSIDSGEDGGVLDEEDDDDEYVLV